MTQPPENNKELRFDPDRVYTPDEIEDHFMFLVAKFRGIGLSSVIYAHDIRNYKTLKESADIIDQKMKEYDEANAARRGKYELHVLYIGSRAQLVNQGVFMKEAEEWVEKLGIPQRLNP